MLTAENQYIQEQSDSGQENINDSGIVAVEYYLKRVRYSHVIYMASLLETFLERECEQLTTAIGAQNIPFELAELKGDQWSKKRKFLERYGQFLVSDEIWCNIKKLILLRNNLVHDNGAVSELKPENKTELSRCPGIALSQTDIVVEADYIGHVFTAIKRFCQEIETEVKKAIERAIRPTSVR